MADTEKRKRAVPGLGPLKGKLISSTPSLLSPRKTAERRRAESYVNSSDIPDRTSFPPTVLLKGNVQLKKQKKVKWAVVDTTSLVLYNSEKGAVESLRKGLAVLGKIEKNNDENSITCFFFTDREITFSFENAQDMNEWGVTLDGILSNNFNRRILEPSTKTNMLEELYVKNIKGGIAKCLCEEEEEWEYQNNKIALHGHPECSYQWDGLKLQGAEEGLEGMWDGSIVRVFYGGKKDAVLHFIYIPVEREYLCTEKEEWSWKWTRHFLASKSGAGSPWLMEGSVPEPIFMILQGFRYLNEMKNSKE